MSLRYSRYGDSTMDSIKHEALTDYDWGGHGELFAHAENSGCEGCYVEVARRNETTYEWQRYCFAKVFGGEHPDLPDARSVETAKRFADDINAAHEVCGPQDVVHRMANYSPAAHPTSV